MGQFSSLIWKNYVIRKRHPMFLLLEVLWPILMFVVLVVMRTGFPPDRRDTCEFQDRALPSAGMVPFLQSSICLLENNCSTPEWNEQRATSQASFRSLIDGVSPILEKETTLDAFKALPKVHAILEVVKDFANDTDLKQIDDKLKLKNMFRDPDKVVDIIANKYAIMSERMAEYLMESSLNPVALLKHIGNLDFKDVVCSPTKLTKYLVTYPKVNPYSLSTALCRIDDDMVSNITNELMKQIDIVNIIKLGEDMANITGDIDMAQLLNDIANLMDMYMADSSLISMVMNFPDLSPLSDAVRKLADIIPLLNDMKDIDYEGIQSLFDVVRPLLKLADGDTYEVMSRLMESALPFAQGASWADVLVMNLPQIADTMEDLIDDATFDTGSFQMLRVASHILNGTMGYLINPQSGDSMEVWIEQLPDMLRESGLQELLMESMDLSKNQTDQLMDSVAMMVNGYSWDQVMVESLPQLATTMDEVFRMLELGDMSSLTLMRLVSDTLNSTVPYMEPGNMDKVMEIWADEIPHILKESGLQKMLMDTLHMNENQTATIFKSALGFFYGYYWMDILMWSLPDLATTFDDLFDWGDGQSMEFMHYVSDVLNRTIPYMNEGRTDLVLEMWIAEMPRIVLDSGLAEMLGLPQEVVSAMLEGVKEFQLALSAPMDDAGSLNATMDDVEKSMRDMLGNETTDMMMALGNSMMNRMDDMDVFYNTLAEDLPYTVINSEAVNTAMDELAVMGPYSTTDFLKDVLSMDNVYNVLNAETTVGAVCLQSASDMFVASSVVTICSPAATQAVQNVFTDGRMVEFKAKMDGHTADMNRIMEGDIPDNVKVGTMNDMYFRMMDMVSKMSVEHKYMDWETMLANNDIPYEGEWVDTWARVEKHFLQDTRWMLTAVMTLESLEKWSMWSEIEAAIYIVDGVLYAANKHLGKAEELEATDQTISNLATYYPYLPFVIESAIGTNMTKISMMSSILTNNTAELFTFLCDNADWESMNFTEVDSASLQQYFCSLDMLELSNDLFSIVDPMGFAANVERKMMADFNTSIDWPEMIGNLQYMVDTVTMKNDALNLMWQMMNIDLNMLGSYASIAERVMTNAASQDMMNSMMNGEGDDLAATLMNIDAAFGPWPLWNRVKNYVYTWQLFAQSMNQYAYIIADNNFTIIEYANNMSPTLGQYLTDANTLTPDVITAIQDGLTNPQQMIERVINANYSGLCADNSSLSDLLGVAPTPDFINFQDGLCKLDWDQIFRELDEHNNAWQGFASQYEIILSTSTDMLPIVTLNWTAVIHDTEEFIMNAQTTLFMEDSIAFPDLGIGAANDSGVNLIDALMSTWNIDEELLTRLATNLDNLMQLLGASEDDSMMGELQHTLAMQTVFQKKYIEFLNYHLGIINETGVFDINAHLHSAEADKLLHFLEAMPEYNQVLLHNFLLFIEDNTKIGEVLGSLNMTAMCEHPEMETWLVIPDGVNLTRTDVIGEICSLMDFEAMISQLLGSMVGLEDLVKAYEGLLMGTMENVTMVDPGVLMQLYERYTLIIVDLTSKEIVVGTAWNYEDDLNRIMEQFANFTEALGQSAAATQSQSGDLDMTTKRVLATVDLVLGFIIERMEPITGNVTIDDLYTNSTDMEELLNALEDLMIAVETKNISTLNESVNVDKMLELIYDTDMLMSKCEDETVAAYISYDGMATNVSHALQKILCINPDMLAMILEDNIQQQMFEKELMRIWNESNADIAFNMTEFSAHVEEFITKFMKWIEQPPVVNEFLLEWMTLDGAINAFSNSYMDIDLYVMLLDAFLPLTVDMSLDSMKILLHLVQPFQGDSLEEIFSNPEKLLEMMNAMFQSEDFINMLKETSIPEKPEREETLNEFVCNYQAIMEWFSYWPALSQSVDTIAYGTLCVRYMGDWNDTLQMQGYTQQDIDTINQVFEAVYQQKLRDYENEKAMTEEIIHSVYEGIQSSLADMFGNDGNQTTEEKVLQDAQEQGFAGMMALVEAFSDPSGMVNMHEILLIIIKVQQHMDYLLQKLTGDESIPLTDVLPSPEALTTLLDGLSGGEASETLMVAFIYPAKFLELLVEDTWEETVCDPDKLSATFDLSAVGDADAVADLQYKLCEEARNNDTEYIEEILHAVDITKLMEEIEKVTSNSSAQFTEASYNEMMGLIEKLIMRMTNLDNVNLTGADNWLETLLRTMEDLTDTTETSLSDSCTLTLEALEPLPGYYDWIRPMLNDISTFIQISDLFMTVQLDVYSNVCEMGPVNLTDSLHRLSDSNIADMIQKLTELMSGGGEPKEFTCASIQEYYSFGQRLVTNLMQSLESDTNIFTCGGDVLMQAAELLEDANQLLTAGTELATLLQDEDVRSLITLIFNTNDTETQALIDEIVNMYKQQEEAMEQLEALLMGNLNDTTSAIEEILTGGTDSLVSIISSAFTDNLDNMTVDDVISLFCDDDHTLSDMAVTGQLLDIIPEDLNATLCGDDPEVAEGLAKDLIKYAQELNELQELASYDSDAFWQKVIEDMLSLVGNVEGLASLSNLASDLSSMNIEALMGDGDLLSTLQTLLTDNSPDVILENLNTLLDNFQVLEDSNQTNALLNDIRYLADGIFAFSSLRSQLLETVKIRDLLKDPDAFNSYMKDTLKIPADVADAIIDGSLSLEMILSVEEADLSELICNSTELAELIKIRNDTDLTAEYLSQQFCSLDKETVGNLVEELFLQMDVGDIVEELVNNGFTVMMDKANLTVEETKEAVTALVNANEDLTEMTEKFNAFAAMNSEAFTSLAEAQTGTEEFGSMSSIICGTQIPAIDDEFNVGESLDQQTSELTNRQKNELKTIEGDACKDMYVQIIESRNGPIIWAYLKPLLRGKVLFTPNTPEIAAIMEKANDTFAFLKNFTETAREWASGSEVLEDLAGGQASDIQELFDSELIKSFMMDIGGVDSRDLDDIIYTFQDADTDIMKSISKVATIVADYVQCIEMARFMGFETESELEMYAAKLSRKNELLAGVIFDMTEPNTRMRRQAYTLPEHVQYKIRMDIDNVMHTNRIKSRFWRPQPEDHFFDEMRYFRGFIQLQDMIDNAIISTFAENENVAFKQPKVTTNQFPFPCHTLDPFVNTIAAYLLPVLMTVSWIAGIAVAVYNLVYDRERGQEETLNIMGLKCGLNFWAWLLTSLVIMAVVAIVDCIILKYGNIFTESNMIIVFFFFLDFIVSTLMLCYFVSAFFTRTSMAILTCLIVYFISYLPFVVLYTLEVDMVFWQKTLACLSSTTAFSYAAQFIARFEEQMIGLQWNNVDKDPLNSDGFSFQWCCIMILIDACIYFVLGWYVRNVRPGKFGVSEPWYFIFVPSRWCCGGCESKEDIYAPSNEDIFMEPIERNSPVVMTARGLSKTYSDGTKAVKNLNLDVHCGAVTTLLGHNGAAKTTTLNMLTGLLQPSKGTIQLLNRPLRAMRGSIGICSQHNALYEYMTVEEHMQFYSSIKDSYNALSAKEEIRQLLKDVDLYHFRKVLVRNLSGGMQRRLSVALAFVGGSKAVILDEPTSGVDPSGRRAIWNLIIRRKTAEKDAGIAVLLSTHHLDEADIISDQIAILHEGKLLCQGSPIFLKHHLASGHRLTVVSDSPAPDPTPILDLIRKWIPGARLMNKAGSDLTYVLPVASDTDFSQFFHDLDAQKEAMGIVTYGVSDPQLQEVFMKVCTTADTGRAINPENVRQMDEDKAAEPVNGNGQEWKHDFDHNGSNGSRERLAKSSRVTGCGLTMQFYGALISKRFLHYIRNWRLLLAVVFLPMLLFLLACALYLVRPESSAAPNLVLTPAMYGPETYVFKKQGSSVLLGLNGEDIVRTFMNKPGIGTTCMSEAFNNQFSEDFQCIQPDGDFSDTVYSLAECKCPDNKYVCNGETSDERIGEMNTSTTEILQDFDAISINSFLLESFEEFIQKRYGGWEFSNGEDENGNTQLAAKIWYNNKGYHSLPAFYNAYSNGLLRAVMTQAGNQPENYGITTYTHPFMFSKEQLSKDTLVYHAADIGIALIIMLAFTFIPVGALLYSVTEYINREKQMQQIAGVGSFIYWMASLFWDLIILGVSVGFAVIILVIFKPESFWEHSNLAAVVSLLALYGFSTITFIYCLSKKFKTAGAAFFTIFCLLNFIGIVTVLIMFTLNYVRGHNASVREAYRICRYAFLIFPPYAIGGGLLDLIDNQIRAVIYERFNVDAYMDPFSLDMIGWNLIAMAIEGVLFLFIAMWMDIRCCCSSRPRGVEGTSNDQDADVLQEKSRIDRGDCRNDAVVVRNLHKIYSSGKTEIHAVNDLSFGIPTNQCFGLLGVNGAGKTTTFKILTGVLHASDGHTSVLGKKILRGSASNSVTIGYCPQEDTLDGYLTVESTLYFNCKLKGIAGDHRKEEVARVMEKLHLDSIKGKLIRSCSGGMKRKVALAIALLGDPPVLLLDEPTTGMDPAAKKLVWDCLLHAKQNGQAIILTSHSLEECDILCDKIGIMVNGEFKCLGSSQHLKQKYGHGYTVTLYVCGLSTSTTRVYELIQSHFPGASIRDQHMNVIQLDIPRDSISISQVFGVLEREKANYNITYYTVSQTTLDTIFLNFAREQTDGASIECSDTNSSSGGYSDSQLMPHAASNPYYAHINPLVMDDKGDKGDNYNNKGDDLSSAKKSSSFILPMKDGFDDSSSYSTKL